MISLWTRFFFEWPFSFWLKNYFRYQFIVLVTNPKKIFERSTYYHKSLSFSSHHDWVILWAVMLKRSFLLLLAPWSIFLSMRWLELDKYIPTFNILKIEPLCWWLRAFWRAFKSWFCWSNMALRRSPESFLTFTLIIGLFHTKVNKIFKFGCARATARANRSVGSKCS